MLVTGLAGLRPVAVLAGADATGTYYAAQALRQIVIGSGWWQRIADVSIRDFPTMAVRGTIADFYGVPWSHQARLDHFAFLGQVKMNTYIYSPTDDPYLRAQWRDPYPADKIADLAELVGRATAHHVKFVYALSPGLDLCFSSDADLTLLIAKFQSLWDVGVRDFNIPFDDINYSAEHCAGVSVFGTGPAGAGAAQALFLDKMNTRFIQTHPGASPLQMVPTEYAGVGPSAYKTAIHTEMDPSILVQWTGQQVVSTSIRTSDAVAAQEVFGHSIFLWDTYPVNDYATDRLFLGPLTGRDRDLGTAITGITSNPMVQSYASMLALVNVADYSWNTKVYDQYASLKAAINFLAGPDPQVRSALTTFGDLNWSWRGDTTKAPLLRADISRFWTDWQAKAPNAGADLSRRLQSISAETTELPKTTFSGFFADAKPWIDAAAKDSEAMTAAIAMLTDLRRGASAAAMRDRGRLLAAHTAALAATVKTLGAPVVPSVGDGQFDIFLTRALELFDSWLGAPAGGVTARPITDMGQYQSYAPGNMIDGDPASLYWTGQTPTPGQYLGVDLGSVQDVSSIVVRESDADTDAAGDYFHHGVLQVSNDGVNWTAVAPATTALVTATPAQPIQARYVRIVAGSENTWVKIREFTITMTGGPTARPPGIAGHDAAKAFDASVDSSYQATRVPSAGDSLSQVFPAARAIAVVDVVGSGRGTVQVRRAGTGQTIGTLSRSSFDEFAAPSGLLNGVRIRWVAGSAAPRIAEVVARSMTTAPPSAHLPGPVPTGVSYQTLTLANAGSAPVTGTVHFDAPTGIRLTTGPGPVSAGRGDVISVPVTVRGITAGR